MKHLAAGLALLLSVSAAAQQTPQTAANAAELEELRVEVQRISARIDALERAAAAPATGSEAVSSAAASATAPASSSGAPAGSPAPGVKASGATQTPTFTADDRGTLDFLRGTTLNFTLDGYYSYNFEEPVGRVNLLRAYTVSSNSFSINQATAVIEHLPVGEPGKRYGGRLDLQFGQATETLQGSGANEQRPQVWRNVFQAYGSYLAPVGSGLQLDFGKFASALGAESNYNKDQINYSRSFLFNYLPFYHTGLRANYNVSSKLNVAYWLVNGAQQTEDFNGFKSQAFLFTMKPSPKLTWNVNYYFGQEQRDVLPTLNPGAPTAPTQPGLPTTNIAPAPNGREHIFDTYATWNVTPKLTLAGEADLVVDRVLAQSPEQHTAAGAVYARYALPRSWAIAGRSEYLDDRSGLFSNQSQAVKEVTVNLDHQLEPGFLARAEYRIDFSNQRFFLTDVAGNLTHLQPTATIGLVYWWGQKQGAW